MSVPQRFYNVLRAYIGREWERIGQVDRDRAERELGDSSEGVDVGQDGRVQERKVGSYIDTSSPPSIHISSRKAPPSQARTPNPPPRTPTAHARRVLGVSADEGYAGIRRAYERLSRRSDPANFPGGSVEARQAEQIHRRVEWAYRLLSEGVDDTDRRFQSLEIE